MFYSCWTCRSQQYQHSDFCLIHCRVSGFLSYLLSELHVANRKFQYINIAPPPLGWKAASDNLLFSIRTHPHWPLHADVVDHPPLRVASCHPIREDTTSVDIIAQRKEIWLLASVVNQHLLCYPIIWQPGFDLRHQTWTLLNHFRTGQGPYHACLHKWGLITSDL